MKKLFLHTCLALTLTSAAGLQAQKTDVHWVGTWAASPLGGHINPIQLGPGNSTYRNIVRISAGGDSIRVQLTNEFGNHSITVGAAHVAVALPSEGQAATAAGATAAATPTATLTANQGAIQPGTDHALTFNGQASVTIPAGAVVFSDPVVMRVEPLASLALSVYLPDQPVNETTCHDLAVSTNYVAPGDEAAAETLSGAHPMQSWCFVKGVDVAAREKDAAAIVTLGDSITDGAHATPDTNRRWPDFLAQRLQADPKTAHLSVLNEGISGNRLLHDGAGPNALARFDRDVLAQSGVKYLIILEGINDIGSIARPREPGDDIGAPDLIMALSQMVARAHEHGIKVFGATLTPYVGAGYASPVGEQVREAVNEWIRASGVFDGVIDFDKATRDAANPTVFAHDADSGDHLHPRDEGYEMMGSAIDLSLFH